MLNLEIKAIIEQAAELVSYDDKGKSYDNKLSNKFLLAQGLDGELRSWAEYFGIDFDATGYTFSTSYTLGDAGKMFINQPRVVRANGQAALIWGDVVKPLAEVKNRYVFNKDGKYNHIVAGEEGDDNTIRLYVALTDKATEPKELNKLKKEGNFEGLAKLLAPDSKRTHIRDCPKGVALKVYGFSAKDKFGKYQLEVEGCGLVTTNTRMKTQVEDLFANWERKPELKQYPVTVTFGEDYKTNDGKNCTKADVKQDIPVASFALADLMDY